MILIIRICFVLRISNLMFTLSSDLYSPSRRFSASSRLPRRSEGSYWGPRVSSSLSSVFCLLRRVSVSPLLRFVLRCLVFPALCLLPSSPRLRLTPSPRRLEVPSSFCPDSFYSSRGGGNSLLATSILFSLPYLRSNSSLESFQKMEL